MRADERARPARAAQRLVALAGVLACLVATGRASAQETGGSMGGGEFSEHESTPSFHESSSGSTYHAPRRTWSPSPSSGFAPSGYVSDDGYVEECDYVWPDGRATCDDPEVVVARRGRRHAGPAERALLAAADGWPPVYVWSLPWLGAALGFWVPIAFAPLRRRLWPPAPPE